MSDSLESILSNEEPVATEPVAVEAVEPVKAEAAEPVKADPVREEPKQEMTDKERAFLAKANDEKSKRQEIERQKDELERRLQALEQKPAAPVEEAKGFWDDPEAALKSHFEQVNQAMGKTRLDTAEAIAKSRHKDYDANSAVFLELARRVPGLGQQCMNAPDPAEFAYQVGKNHRELREAGSMDAVRAKMETELRIKITEEMKQKADADKNERDSIPPSLSDARNTGVNKTVWSGPDSLDNILHH